MQSVICDLHLFLYELLHACSLTLPGDLFTVNCFTFRSATGEHGRNFSPCSVIGTRCWRCQRGCRAVRSTGCFWLLSKEDPIFWVTACKEGTFLREPGHQWRDGDRGTLSPLSPSHSSRSGDAKQLPTERNVSFTKNTVSTFTSAYKSLQSTT